MDDVGSVQKEELKGDQVIGVIEWERQGMHYYIFALARVAESWVCAVLEMSTLFIDLNCCSPFRDGVADGLQDSLEPGHGK
jgi:hypothetical protein